jgi:hypothetical protein
MVASGRHGHADLLREAQALRTLAGVAGRRARMLEAALREHLPRDQRGRIAAAVARHQAEQRELLARADRLEERPPWAVGARGSDSSTPAPGAAPA